MTSELENLDGFIDKIPENISVMKHIIKPKTLFVQRGEIIERLYIVCSGSMVAYNEFENGNIVFVEKLKGNSLIGDVELLSGLKNFICSVSSQSECLLISISPEDFINWFEADEQFARWMTRRISLRNCNQASQIGSLKYYNSNYLIGSYLLNLASPQLKMEKDTILKLTRIELAQTLGVSERTVNRVIKKLIDAKIVYQKRYGQIGIRHEKYSELMHWLNDNRGVLR